MSWQANVPTTLNNDNKNTFPQQTRRIAPNHSIFSTSDAGAGVSSIAGRSIYGNFNITFLRTSNKLSLRSSFHDSPLLGNLNYIFLGLVFFVGDTLHHGFFLSGSDWYSPM